MLCHSCQDIDTTSESGLCINCRNQELIDGGRDTPYWDNNIPTNDLKKETSPSLEEYRIPEFCPKCGSQPMEWDIESGFCICGHDIKFG